MKENEFVYTTYIKTTPDKVWEAITNPEFARQYWGGLQNVSDWKKGSKWRHVNAEDGSSWLIGEVVESIRPKRLVLTWADPDDTADESRVTFEIKPVEDMVCLTVIHGDFKLASKMAPKVCEGWPRVLSSMKSFLETGKGLNVWAGMEETCRESANEGAAA